MDESTDESTIRMVLVEDDRDSGEALKVMLDKNGIDVTMVPSAEDVVDDLDIDDFDIVVADIRLEGMSGIDLLRHIRKESSDFPVVLITGYDSLESAVEAIRLGAQDYILKPFDSIDDLLIPVRKAVANHRLRMRNTELEVDLNRRCEELRKLGVRLGESEEAERRRICRELHDQVGGTLTSLGMNLNVAHEKLAEGRENESLERIRCAQTEAEEIAGCLRRVMSELYPAVLDDYGLPAALRWYGQEFLRKSGLRVNVAVQDLSTRLPPTTETTLFRIAQEGLTNVLKHAEAECAGIRLEETGSILRLVIEDDGKGIHVAAEPRRTGGWGMLFMRERAEAIGGEFRVVSAPRDGTSIVVTIERASDDYQGDSG